MKICFVGHKFHERTRSSDFIQSILRELGELTVLNSSPDEDRMSDDSIVLEYLENKYDLWVFHQTEYIAARLIPLGLRNAVIAPMYDGAWSRPDDFFRQFVNCRFLSYSRALHTRLQRLDQRSAFFEYWPAPAPKVERSTEREDWSAFFWERRPLLMPNARSVAQQCRALDIERLHIHAVPDFPEEAVSAHGYRQRNALNGVSITTSTWFDSADAFRETSGTPLFHFAPRLYEGIGMTMLEAMARGQIVIAPDRPTANEYIGHLSSGILYDPERPLDLPELAPGDVAEMSAAARQRVVRGHETWLADRERLVSFLTEDGRRWPNTDAGAHFGLTIRRAARARRMKAIGK